MEDLPQQIPLDEIDHGLMSRHCHTKHQ